MHPFVPVLLKIEKGDPVFVDSPEVNTLAFHVSLDKILTGYGVEHEMRNGIVYISGSLWNDRELMMNYTSKALSE